MSSDGHSRANNNRRRKQRGAAGKGYVDSPTWIGWHWIVDPVAVPASEEGGTNPGWDESCRAVGQQQSRRLQPDVLSETGSRSSPLLPGSSDGKRRHSSPKVVSLPRPGTAGCSSPGPLHRPRDVVQAAVRRSSCVQMPRISPSSGLSGLTEHECGAAGVHQGFDAAEATCGTSPHVRLPSVDEHGGSARRELHLAGLRQQLPPLRWKEVPRCDGLVEACRVLREVVGVRAIQARQLLCTERSCRSEERADPRGAGGGRPGER